MRAADLRAFSALFDRITELHRWRVTNTAAATEAGDCDCTPNTDGVHRAAEGTQCSSAAGTPDGFPAGYCRSVVSVVLRSGMHQLRLPAHHLTDEQLDDALGRLTALVDRAPQVTEQEFVLELQRILRATPDQPNEETTAP